MSHLLPVGDGLSPSDDCRPNGSWSSGRLAHRDLPGGQPLHVLPKVEIFPQSQLRLSFCKAGWLPLLLLPCPTLSAVVV